MTASRYAQTSGKTSTHASAISCNLVSNKYIASSYVGNGDSKSTS